MSGLMGTMATGMAFGAGSEIAHQGVRAMMGGGGGHGGGHEGDHQGQPAQQQYAEQPAGYGQQAMEQPAQQQENPCMTFNQSLITCLQQNRGEITLCQNYMDMLTQCERDTSMRNYQ